MKTIEIKENTLLKLKGFTVSIGIAIDKIAIISSNGEFTPITTAKISKRLAKIKRTFKANICSDTHFFFEFMTNDDTIKLINILK